MRQFPQLFCVRTSGHAAAAPPSSATNSRRFISKGRPSGLTSLDRAVCAKQR